MSTAKPFQDATVNAALAAFAKTSRRRFLVADEVGLGKTVVAREIARRMSEDASRPLTVYYIANGHSVSVQNKKRLAAFLEDDEREPAIRTPDRLSLIARTPRPCQNVVIYALTPGTSFPGARTRLTGGKKEERAFLKVLLDKAYPAFARTLDPAVLRLNVGSSWPTLVAAAEARRRKAPPNLTRRFREALALEFETRNVRAKLELAVCGTVGTDKGKLKPAAFVGRLRRALALATLRHQPPDLVILDEFQRYRHLLEEQDADPLLRALLEPDGSSRRPAILMLSATPFRLLTTRWEESQGTLAHAQFMELIGFLAGKATKARAAELFQAFGETLRRIVAQAPSGQAAPAQDIAAAARLRDELQDLLRPVMSRTERDSVASGDAEARTAYLDAAPVVEDFRVFRHLVESFAEKDRHEALPYWSSIPLPAQAMGPRYAAARRARFRPDRSLPQLTLSQRNRLAAPECWPDAKMRALGQIATPAQLSLPWSAPSLQWWPLAGGWKVAGADPKLLLFSRFRATPSAVASLLSFAVEAKFLPSRRRGYKDVGRSRRFKLAAVPGPVMAAFHPSAWLIANTNPLARPGAGLGRIRREIRRQILAALPGDILAMDKAKDRRRHRSIGQTLAALDKLHGMADRSADAWSAATGDDKAALAAIDRWRTTPKLDSLSPAELDDLVEYALSAPGVVLGRALHRHDPTILDPGRFPLLVKLSWQGLRNYLDNPVFLSSLPGKTAVEQVMRAVVDGGLESVLDEHFWFRAQGLAEGPVALASDLLASLGLRAGSFTFHEISRARTRFPVRCHVAVPFGDAEAGSASNRGDNDLGDNAARPEEVRQAFNTPFWPHVLATTSVGQEGLDFHPWCSRVAHWDLTSSPLDLEQREGRVQRYAGLAIRRKLATRLRKDWLDRPDLCGSPWRCLEQLAQRYVDHTGLKPWWVCDGAEIHRHVFERPFGRDMTRFALLREQRMIYRLALGQPNQEDFIDLLASGGEGLRELLSPLVLDLSAMGLRSLGAPLP